MRADIGAKSGFPILGRKRQL